MGSNESISLSEIISALSYALDLTESGVLGHALRSCLLGMRIASELRLSEEETSGLYFSLLLKDAGCGSNATRMSQIIGGEGLRADSWSDAVMSGLSSLRLLWKDVRQEAGPPRAWNARDMIRVRSERGASIVGKLGLGTIASQAVRSLDEHWDGGGHPDALKGEQIPLLSRICAIAQHLDIFSAKSGVDKAVDTMITRRGTWFDPDLVEIAVSLHKRGGLWKHCLPSDSQEETRQAVLDLDAGRHHTLESGRIDEICEAFADVVDAKSHFTFRHSMGVADTANAVARAMGLAPDRVQLVRRAALLHDIGKLSLPNTLLDKKTPLNEEEWEAVYQHPSLTRRILERVGAFREMAIIAGEHHEKLDGSGYPNALMAPDLSLESRIVATADVYGALSEDRPYRRGLGSQTVIAILTKQAPKKLDSDCVDALLSTISQGPVVEFEPAAARTIAQFCA